MSDDAARESRMISGCGRRVLSAPLANPSIARRATAQRKFTPRPSVHQSLLKKAHFTAERKIEMFYSKTRAEYPVHSIAVHQPV